MLTDYDIQRISSAIVENLTNNDKFIGRVAKLMDKRGGRVLNTRQAAEKLGVTRKTVCSIASHLGGVRGNGRSSHWMFPEEGLVERYIEYKNR